MAEDQLGNPPFSLFDDLILRPNLSKFRPTLIRCLIQFIFLSAIQFTEWRKEVYSVSANIWAILVFLKNNSYTTVLSVFFFYPANCMQPPMEIAAFELCYPNTKQKTSTQAVKHPHTVVFCKRAFKRIQMALQNGW